MDDDERCGHRVRNAVATICGEQVEGDGGDFFHTVTTTTTIWRCEACGHEQTRTEADR